MASRVTGLTFHRTFSLSRPSITEILQLAATQPKSESGLSRKDIRAGTTLGTIYVESMPRYALGAGLLDEKNRLTPFGRLAVQHDLQLALPATQWMMHYYLSAPEGPGPAFWHDLVTSHFRPGNQFSAEELGSHLADFVEQTEGKPLAERTVRSTITTFLGTYTKSDGLGGLGLLEQDGSSYYVRESSPPPASVVAVALAEYWDQQFRGRVTVNESDLLDQSTLPDIFLMGRSAFDATLRELQRAHIVDLHRTAPPYQIVLLQPDPQDHLIRLYGSHDATPSGYPPTR